jgi:hypothetical protein
MKDSTAIAGIGSRVPALRVVRGSARLALEIVSQYEREADYQDAHSDAHQNQSSSCGPKCCTLPRPPPLISDPDRAGHPRRVIGSASRQNNRVLSQFPKPPAAATGIIEGDS